MTTGEIIKKVNELKPNAYTDQTKLTWLSELDAKIFQEVILTHYNPHFHHHKHHHCRNDAIDQNDDQEQDESSEEETEKPEKKPFTGYTTYEEELLVPFPYGGDIYVFYLMSQIDFYNAEIAKYNQSITLFNNAYQTYFNWYNRNHTPIRKGGRFRF